MLEERSFDSLRSLRMTILVGKSGGLLPGQRVSMLRVAAGDFADKAVQSMNGPALGEKHERALPRDHANPSLAAELNGLRADCALSSRPMHPNARNTSLGTITHDRVRNFG
jgi:hypothetical protein